MRCRLPIDPARAEYQIVDLKFGTSDKKEGADRGTNYDILQNPMCEFGKQRLGLNGAGSKGHTP